MPKAPRLCLLLLAAAMNLRGVEYGLRDPEFARVPFEEWLRGSRQTRMRWSVEIAPPVLSTHQRMIVGTHVLVGGILARPAARGKILFLECRDAAGRVWQQHVQVDPKHLQPGFEKGTVLISDLLFLLPGDYTMSFALWDPAGGGHSVIVKKVQVKPLSRDPLPAAWTGLPAVEFIPTWNTAGHDIWFLPGVAGRLNLPVQTRRHLNVEVMLNATPSQQSSGSTAALRRNMSVLIPAVKALTGLRLSEGTLAVSMLDLTRRKTVFTQKDVHALDWERMERFFSDSNPGLVDAQSLALEGKMREYFLSEITRAMSARDGQAHVVVVLSGPAFMDNQEPLPSAWPQGVKSDADHKLIYIRYRNEPSPLRPRRPRPGMAPRPLPPTIPMPLDDLERAVEPMGAYICDATSAAQFRRILAAVLDQLSSF